MTQMTCILCPKGCHLCVDEENGCTVTGFSCQRGREYGQKEILAPTRTITSTVRITGGLHPRCPVKTNGELPKELIFQAMALLEGVTLRAPVQSGDRVVENICGTGIDFVVCKAM